MKLQSWITLLLITITEFILMSTESAQFHITFRTSDKGRYKGFKATVICFKEEDANKDGTSLYKTPTFNWLSIDISLL